MKRLSTDDPLTPDDVAERLVKAAMRTLRVLLDVRQTDGLFDDVKRSRYLRGSLNLLADELREWGVSS